MYLFLAILIHSAIFLRIKQLLTYTLSQENYDATRVYKSNSTLCHGALYNSNY